MTTSIEIKRDRLLELLSGYGRVAVAFSGGVDSAVVAKAAALACDRAVAVTAVSPSLAGGELEEAQRIAEIIGLPHQVLRTQELDRTGYVQNAGDRCYHCKTELYEQLEQRLDRLGCDVIVNGANLDDRGDYRPGMTAAAEHRVRSPLIEAELNKQDVRALARAWELPIWDKPASPCLSSRIAYGVSVTPERLSRIDRAEAFLKGLLQIRELRVREEAGELARIEIPLDSIRRLTEPGIREQIVENLSGLGFRAVTLDLAGFRSGNLNAALVQLAVESGS